MSSPVSDAILVKVIAWFIANFGKYYDALPESERVRIKDDLLLIFKDSVTDGRSTTGYRGDKSL
jgi:hypothetical protein